MKKKLNLGVYGTAATERIAEQFLKQSLPWAVRKIIPGHIYARLSLNLSQLIYRLAYEDAFEDRDNPLEVEDENRSR